MLGAPEAPLVSLLLSSGRVQLGSACGLLRCGWTCGLRTPPSAVITPVATLFSRWLQGGRLCTGRGSKPVLATRATAAFSPRGPPPPLASSTGVEPTASFTAAA